MDGCMLVYTEYQLHNCNKINTDEKNITNITHTGPNQTNKKAKKQTPNQSIKSYTDEEGG